MLQVVDRRAPDQLRRLVARAPVRIHDDGALSGKILEQAGTNGLHHLTDSSGIVVGGNTHKDVRFPDVNQLAKKLIRKNAFLGQIVPPLEFRSCADETNRTGMDPKSADRANLPPWGKCFVRTSRSGYS